MQAGRNLRRFVEDYWVLLDTEPRLEPLLVPPIPAPDPPVGCGNSPYREPCPTFAPASTFPPDEAAARRARNERVERALEKRVADARDRVADTLQALTAECEALGMPIR